ncbi:MAG: DUF4012 domain-containing protein [bacterium]
MKKQNRKFVTDIIKDHNNNKVVDLRQLVEEIPTASPQVKIEKSLVQNIADEIPRSKSFVIKKLSWAGLLLLVMMIFPGLIKFSDYVNNNLLAKQGVVLGEALNAFDHAKSAGSSLADINLESAVFKFNLAAEGFKEAKTDIDETNVIIREIVKVLPGGSKLASAEHMLEAGANLSQAGESLAKAMQPLNSINNTISGAMDTDKKNRSSITENLLVSKAHLEVVKDKVALALDHIEKVNVNDLPENQREQFDKIKSMVPQIRETVSSISTYSDSFLELLGHNMKKRYLLLFTNNREVRKGGGFIGTYGLLDIQDGNITKLFVEGPYNIDGQLKETIASPTPLHLINPTFYMRDANFFLDYPTSAQKVAELYEKSGGVTVDGVISINASLMPKLLKITGPVAMPEYDTTINYENFYDQTQVEVEFEYDKEENKPKQFIADLMPKIFEKLSFLESNQTVELVNLLFGSLQNKEIMLYFFDDNLQQLASENGFTGEVPETDKDYLAIAESNIGGGKTSNVIKRDVDLKTNISSDGKITNELKIVSSHTGDPENIWSGIKNVTYLEIFVPQGAKLIKAEGFDDWIFSRLKPELDNAIDDSLVKQIENSKSIHKESSTVIGVESEKTTFGNWLEIAPSEKKEITLVYELPFKIDTKNNSVDSYSIYYQKQAGTNPLQIKHVIEYPDNYKSLWNYNTLDNLDKEFNLIRFSGQLDRDMITAFVLENINE